MNSIADGYIMSVVDLQWKNIEVLITPESLLKFVDWYAKWKVWKKWSK